MTLHEILKAKGLSDEQVKEVIGEMKTNKIFTASEENLDVRYGKLKTDHDALTAKDAESQKLIAELQKATKGQESVQNKITEYESTIQKQSEELAKLKADAEIKVGLLGAGAKESDLDYLMYKMTNGDWKAELDADGKVKGLDEKLKGMKTQFPAQFESSSKKTIEEKKLEKPETKPTMTKEQFNKMGYQERVKFRQENPESYAEFTK